MSELETRIRDALRADEIGWDDLREPALRTDTPRSPRRWPAVLATAAAVAVVATVAAVIATSNGTSNAPAGNPAYAGYTWQLTEVTDQRSTIDVASVPAQIAFSNTAVSGTLAGASIFGHYSPTPDGYALTDIGFAGTSGKIADRSELGIGSPFASVFVHANGRNLDPNRPASVVAQVTGDRLVLQANGVTLRLSKVGPSGLLPMVDAAGYTWRVTGLTDREGQLAVAQRLGATVGFDRAGHVVGNDTVNTYQGRYGLTNGGYVVADSATGTAVGYGGQTPTILRLIPAVDAMVSSNAPVTATLESTTLTLRHDGITLTLQRGNAQRPYRFTMTAANDSGTPESAPNTPITEPGASVAATR